MLPCLHNPCPGSGVWRPVLELRSRRDGEITHLRFTKIAVCDEHKQSNEITHYLSIEAFNKLVKIMKETGKKAPVRRFTTLTWESTPSHETLPAIVTPCKDFRPATPP